MRRIIPLCVVLAACDARTERPAAFPEPAAAVVTASLRPQPALDPAARAYCYEQVRRVYRGPVLQILDSVEVTLRGPDTVLVAGAVDFTGEDGGRFRAPWTCDVIREEGRWRSWHFGTEPVERIGD